jgi:hypothetical protein
MRVIKLRRACSTYGRQKRYIKGFRGGDMRKRDNLEDLSVDFRIVLSGLRSWMEKHRLDYSDSGQGQMVGVVKAAMKSWFLKMQEI